MCGIAGATARTPAPRAPAAWAADVQRMLAAQRHRGPDQESVVEVGATVLGANRLAVIDPEHGAQPMSTAGGRFWLALNGAVVNHVELRADLEARGVRFRTRCDTEVLLALLVADGRAGLARVNGMFAGAFVDARDGSVLLFRDPCGIKPLYWAQDGDRTLFASEPKALLEALRARPSPDDCALLDYLAFQLPVEDRTFFEGIRRVPPGSLLVLSPGQPPAAAPLPEWSRPVDVPPDAAAAAAVLRGLLEDAVRVHLRADVPLGAHLSGGVDSSLVAALAARGTSPLHVFTGAFDVPGFDERPHARAVAASIGAIGHEIVPSPEDLAEALPSAVRAMDEPAAGPGLLPQWCVARLAAADVRVVLGGQGGDELFSGYVRHLVLHLEQALSDATADGDTRRLRRLAPHLASLEGYEPLVRGHFAGRGSAGPADRYFDLMYRGRGLETTLSGGLRDAFLAHPARERFRARFEAAAAGRPDGARTPVGDAVRFERSFVLPALLQVEDRTSSAWSLESRVPLLDRRVLSFVDRCPDDVLFGDGGLKHLLRRAADDLLPEAARTRRDKMGFPVPLAAWARGPLRPMLRDLLLDGTARGRGFYDAPAVERLLAGEDVAARHLWALVNVELWHRTYAS